MIPEAESRLATLPDLGRATVVRVGDELLRTSVPMICQILRIIKDLSHRPESLSVNDLVDFISSEPTAMSQVIAIANTLGYNTRGVEVVSVHHAVSLIGFNRVRTLALSILLLESAQSRSTAEINRELAGVALISGLAAAEMCRLGVGVDPELAFICAALRSYGRMLAATFLPAIYAEVVKAAALEGYERAFETRFGLPALELGREVLIQMKVPSPIIHSFERASRVLHSGSSNAPADALIAVADFGTRGAELLQAPDLTHDNFEFRLVALSKLYDFPVPFTRPEARQILHHVVNVIESFRYQAGVYLGTVMIFRRAKSLAAEAPLPSLLSPRFEPPPAKPAPAREEPPNFEI